MKSPKLQFENLEGVKFCEECDAKFELPARPAFLMEENFVVNAATI